MENTNFVLFHTPNEPLVRTVREIATENMVINRVDAVQYLGITIDEKLSWNAYAKYVCNSLIKCFGSFKQSDHKNMSTTASCKYTLLNKIWPESIWPYFKKYFSTSHAK